MAASDEGLARERLAAGPSVSIALGIWFVFALVSIVRPPIEGEFGWQRLLGQTILHTHALPHALGAETFTARGAPWIPQEWAFALLVDATTTWSAGYLLLVTLVSGATAAALAIAARTAARLGAHPGITALVVTLAATQTFTVFSLRAQMLVWPFVALLVRWMLLRRYQWRLVPLTAAWANLHGSAVLAPAIVAVTALGALLDARRIDDDVRRLGLVALGSAAAVCATPLGPQLWQLAVMLEASPVHQYITEWHVPAIDHPTVFAFIALALVLKRARL